MDDHVLSAAMKWMALSFAALGFIAVLPIPEANAIACHAGVYRSGCVGPRGAYVRGHYPRYGANRCAWRAGRRVCW